MSRGSSGEVWQWSGPSLGAPRFSRRGLFLVAADDTNEMVRAVMKMQHEACSKEEMAQALAAFKSLSDEGLSPGARQRCRIAADAAMQAAMGGSPQAAAGGTRQELADLTDDLLRFEVNRFRTPLSAGCGEDAYALFRTISRLNHSCQPTATVRWETAGSDGGASGRVVVRAARDLAPGEALTINYGLPDIESWPVSKRRASMFRLKGFMCQCAKCVEEGGPGMGRS
mmetsp:Transcript_10770/g.33908  ORF Transcript_10770/g.33908 Transcript_10770/m.33908 type:complete len:227 (+) Transcript_10770:561-1241(+)